MTVALRWDLFCRVIDNHGDLGVCWRLASQLAARGHACRLWVDDASALTWMAPPTLRAASKVDVAAFDDAMDARPGDVVIEAFGCDPPAGFVERMQRATPPTWINLEYLSAQDYVERSHGLPSPQFGGPGAGLTKWFFFPGFTSGSGGLLRAPRAPRASTAPALAAALPSRRPGERMVFVLAYAHARLEPLLDALDVEPTLVLAARGPSQAALERLFDARGRRGRQLRLHALPWLDQASFDALLDACDLNIVRGEDSLVRALWAGKPFVWNIYAQDDGAHAAKLEALLDGMFGTRAPSTSTQATTAPTATDDIRQHFRGLNGLVAPGVVGTAMPSLDAPRLTAWRNAITPWLEGLRMQDDLVTRLEAFVARKVGAPAPEDMPR